MVEALRKHKKCLWDPICCGILFWAFLLDLSVRFLRARKSQHSLRSFYQSKFFLHPKDMVTVEFGSIPVIILIMRVINQQGSSKF